MPYRQEQSRNTLPDTGVNNPDANQRKNLDSLHDNQHYEIVAYPDLLLTFAQIRFKKIMEGLDSVRQMIPGDTVPVDIQKIEENLKIMYRMYEKTLPYLARYYQGNKQDF